MPKQASTVFAVAALAGIAATLGARKRTARPASASTPPPVAAASHRTAWELPETGADRAAQIIATILIVVGVASIAFLLFAPAAARVMPASNDEIRSHYGINVVDNPNFKGATFLKGGDDGLAYVCDRPSQGDLLASKDLSCRMA
jgi:hypothetical protein